MSTIDPAGLPQVGRAPGMPSSIEIFDTTLRDGVQFEGISPTVDDKLAVAEQLDRLGVAWIEGGWPGANPKDVEFFARATTELTLDTARLVAFGSTRRAGVEAADDKVLHDLVQAGTETVCIVGKSWDYHVTEALRTTLDEGAAMVADSIRFLKEQGLRVFFDAEHWFDGYKSNSAFSLQILHAAAEAGVDCFVMCDTNGGSLPDEVERIASETASVAEGIQLGIHTQNDSGCAVANGIAAVRGGATHAQGTINGYGERTGNMDLTTFVPNLTLKLGIATIPPERLVDISSVSGRVAELLNMPPQPAQPYVGVSAFAHKAGLHTSAISRRPDTYEHCDPALVGNRTRFLVSDLGGRASVELKASQLGIDIDPVAASSVASSLKELENEGFHFEVADASLELMIRQATGWVQPYFEVESFRVVINHQQGTGNRAWNDIEAQIVTDAIVTVVIDDERLKSVAEGSGPVDALYAAFRAAVNGRLPALDRIHLVDYKVRIVDSGGTDAITRVLITLSNGERTWTTIGVSFDIIEASWHALADGVIFGLLHAGEASNRDKPGPTS